MDRTPNNYLPWDTHVRSSAQSHSKESSDQRAGAACFLGALQLVASRAGKKNLAENAKVNTSVFLGHPTDPNLEGFGLRVEITVEGCEDDALIQAAHEVCPAPCPVEEVLLYYYQFCPYSRAIKHGIEVKVTKA